MFYSVCLHSTRQPLNYSGRAEQLRKDDKDDGKLFGCFSFKMQDQTLLERGTTALLTKFFLGHPGDLHYNHWILTVSLLSCLYLKNQPAKKSKHVHKAVFKKLWSQSSWCECQLKQQTDAVEVKAASPPFQTFLQNVLHEKQEIKK